MSARYSYADYGFGTAAPIAIGSTRRFHPGYAAPNIIGAVNAVGRPAARFCAGAEGASPVAAMPGEAGKYPTAQLEQGLLAKVSPSTMFGSGYGLGDARRSAWDSGFDVGFLRGGLVVGLAAAIVTGLTVHYQDDINKALGFRK